MRDELLRISRPRFWLYLLGPFLLGAFAAAPNRAALLTAPFWLGLLYFTLPANLLVYGVNDLCDTDTDAHNAKKDGYEQRVQHSQQRRLRAAIIALNLPLLALLAVITKAAAAGALVAFLVFSIFYSAPPVRAKARPLLDASFNVLYVFPGVFGYMALGGSSLAPLGFVAAWAWCMAMHAFSAIPDIAADRAAGLATTATWLGERGTLIFCGVLYSAAAVLALPVLGPISLVAGGIYLGLLTWAARTELFGVYRRFPIVNGAIGFVLVWSVILARWGVLTH